jgi:serine/threonine protein kinase
LAIKTYHVSLEDNDEKIEFAWREIELLPKLHHPCIVKFEGLSCGPGREGLKIATVYADGGSLKEVQQSKPDWWDWTAKSRTIAGIVLGMRYLHSKNIVHRDLKPSNILMKGREHSVEICDFKASRLSSIEKTFTHIIETAQYMASEMYDTGDDDEGNANPDPTEKIDVFSFGLILYEIFVGSPVFSSSDSPFTVIQRLRAQDLPTVPSSCGRFMQNLIGQCWQPNPANRPSFHDILGLFRDRRFDIVPNATTTDIEAFCEAIVEWERRSHIPQ